MNPLSRILRSNFIIKLRSWEYWPFGVLQAPVFPYWIWLSIKARSLIFFSASNPGIRMGGMFGESKFEVLEKVPVACKPKTMLIKLPTVPDEVMDRMQIGGLSFPVIFKPDLGERGWMVKRITSRQDVEAYLKEIKIDFLVQECVDLPLEFGVFYVRYPSEPTGKVTSIVGKEMLSVTGDGIKKLQQLILEKDRAKLQWQVLKKVYQKQLTAVIPSGEKIELVSIGNHCLGTMFLNNNHLITEKLSAAFDRISKQIPDFYFGRYDLKVASLEDLERGTVQIVELNGCGAEPAHIYQPGFPFMKAVKVILHHWQDIYRISRENHQRGVPYLSYKEAKTIYHDFKALTSF